MMPTRGSLVGVYCLADRTGLNLNYTKAVGSVTPGSRVEEARALAARDWLMDTAAAASCTHAWMHERRHTRWAPPTVEEGSIDYSITD
jgi:hypothetical protein